MILVKPVTKLVDNLVQLKIWLQTVIEARKEFFSSRVSKCYNDYYDFSISSWYYHSCSCINAFLVLFLVGGVLLKKRSGGIAVLEEVLLTT